MLLNGHMSLLKVVCKSFLPTDLYITNKMVKNKGVPEQKPLFHFPPHALLLLLLLFLRASGLRNESIWDSLSSCSTALTDLSLSFWAQRLPRKWRSCLTKPASFLISDLIFPRRRRTRSLSRAARTTSNPGLARKPSWQRTQLWSDSNHIKRACGGLKELLMLPLLLLSQVAATKYMLKQ